VQEQLQITLQQEQERATRDPLTGLRNHRYFQESLHTEIERCRRTGGHVTIAALDLDNFKQVNDRFGHSEGDAVLRRATKVISDNLRPYDLACRLGGEEFGIIFPEATAEQAKVVLDRIAAQILPLGPNGERLSFSGGLTTWPTHASSQSDLFHRADEASYAAKMAGKAQSLIYDPSTVASMDSEERTKSRSRDAMLTTATTLVSAVDQKDPYTRNHSELVAVYSATIARAMQLDEQTVKLVYRAGLLHDVGKIGISDSILVKNGELTHDEWIQLRMHPEFSYRILLAAEMEPVATWTRHHHEHVDGTGYPLGLAGDDIPLGSRIILVADAFESMTSDRIYRRALGLHQAIHELRTGAGAQFDAQVVETMVQLVEAGVFTQVMEQYGRVVATTSVDEHGYPVQHDPATVVAAGQVRSDALAQRSARIEARECRLIGQRVHLERAAHDVHRAHDRRWSDAPADAQAREAVDLRHRAQHHDVLATLRDDELGDAVGVVIRDDVLVVRLIDHAEHVARQRIEEAAQLVAADVRTRGVVGIADVDHARARRDSGEHRVEVVAVVVVERHLDGHGAHLAQADRVRDEARPAEHHLVTGFEQ
jgi:diguanylate cyclase (GGDEF)-like protein